MKIQLDLSELENKILGIIKAINGLKSKKEAIKFLIMEKQDLLRKLQK